MELIKHTTKSEAVLRNEINALKRFIEWRKNWLRRNKEHRSFKVFLVDTYNKEEELRTKLSQL